MVIAATMVDRPDASIPQRSRGWADTLACYRFFNNERVEPEAVQRAAAAQTLQACAAMDQVLCLHDLTQIKPVKAVSPSVLQQHTLLAVDPRREGHVIGLLDQRWFDDPQTPVGETRRQRRQRWTRSQVWSDAVHALRQREDGRTRWIHVVDREGDDFQLFSACREAHHGFLVRSQHDRHLIDGQRLCDWMDRQPVIGNMDVDVPHRSAAGQGKLRREARSSRLARLAIRFTTVTLACPMNDPRFDSEQTVSVICAREQQSPKEGGEPIHWRLLTSEPVTCLDDALRIIQWYRQRWLIEEFHKAQKTGCRLEQVKFQQQHALCVLAAIAAVVAVRLLQLRQAARDEQQAHQPATQHMDRLWVLLVARLARHDPKTLTVRQFYHTIARHGGWLGRNHDGPPGWQTLWRGWQRIADHIQGIQLLQAHEPPEESCV